MKLWLIQLRDSLADSFWFLPALMVAMAIGGALGSVALDHSIGSAWVQDIGWVWSGGADGARSVLSVVAGSVMTVVSIVFSLTISVLAQTSSHFGPRVLRNFTSDRVVQFTLGTFIATFTYCLLVLRTVRSVEELTFVPYLSVNIGIALALASLAVLILFIHHIAQSIQAENLIASVGQDFQRAIPALFPEKPGTAKAGENDENNLNPDSDDEEWQHAVFVNSAQNGYLQRVDEDRLFRLAIRHNLRLQLQKRPGQFVVAATPLLRAMPLSHLTSKVEGELKNCFSFGLHRTPHQDPLYSIQQLVEIAAHALSPGINEPYTAMTCMDWLGASLRAVLERDPPSQLRVDQDGQLRLKLCVVDFKALAQATFDPIRLYGAASPDIMASLLHLLEDLAPLIRDEADRSILLHQAALIGADASQIINKDDHERVSAFLYQAQKALTKVNFH